MKLDEFNKCIGRFFAEVVSPKAKPNTQFKIGFAGAVGRLAVQPDQLADMQAAGIVDKDGDVKLDLLKKGLEGGFAATKEYHVEKLGLYFSKDDLDKFIRLCETGKAD